MVGLRSRSTPSRRVWIIEVMLGGPLLEQAVNHEGELRQPVDASQLLRPGRRREPGSQRAALGRAASRCRRREDRRRDEPGDADATSRALAAAAAAAQSDVVLDYLWGKPAQQAMVALLTARSDRGRALDWIQIGAVAGPAIELASVALRSANLRLQGSGQGAVPAETYRAELPALAREITAGTIAVKANTMPLAEVEQAWTQTEVPGERTVLIP